MTPAQKYAELYKQMANLCQDQGWGDPFSYARSKEIYAACEHNHTIADSFSGADAFNQAGDPVEYKSTTGPRCKGAYTGISVQDTWERQEEYLLKEKLAKYPEHYYNRFDRGVLVESWKMTGDKVYELLLPKLKKKYPDVLTKKDPRLGANISWTEIQQYGIRVI